MTDNSELRIRVKTDRAEIELEGSADLVEAHLKHLLNIVLPTASGSMPTPASDAVVPRMSGIPKPQDPATHLTGPISTSPPDGSRPDTSTERILPGFSNIIDLESGQVLLADAGKTVADRHRRIAAILAMRSHLRGGPYQFTAKELRAQLERFSAYDPDSTATYLRRLKVGNSLLFVRSGKGWKATAPGEAYVRECVRTLIAGLGLSHREKPG